MTSRKQTRSWLPVRIVSGGQTGVDRAGLDFAIDLGMEHGGWCPAGRLAEDGRIPNRYQLTEHDSPFYPARTEQNVLDSDATLILFRGRLSGGSKLTKRLAVRHAKAFLSIDISEPDVRPGPNSASDADDLRPPGDVAFPMESSPSRLFTDDVQWSELVDRVRSWLQATPVNTLNVAGPRESTSPGIERAAKKFLHLVFAGDGA
ncbi:MAG: putative molybdenum carrier protein [Planctomycetota bacterium]